MLKHTTGDLLLLAEDGEFDAIVHGCNCFCTMGAGIAKQIRDSYPAVWKADKHTTAGDYDKLGGWTEAVVGKFIIFNAYTQFRYNSPGVKTDMFEYTSFKLILQKLAYMHGKLRFGFPMIGMGLAGGDKYEILAMLEEFAVSISAKGGSATVVELESK